MSRFLTPFRSIIVRSIAIRNLPAASLSSSSLSYSSASSSLLPSSSSSPSPLRFFHLSPSFSASSEPLPLERKEVASRVIEVIKKFEKIKDPSKVTESATFAADLGLDSLDAVEIVMNLEEEFGIEIPDAEADKILTVADAVKYIASNPKAQ